jgi:hypothetical protein
MQTPIEGDLNVAIPLGRVFEIGVKSVDAERVPISEWNRLARSIPRFERLAAADFHQ